MADQRPLRSCDVCGQIDDHPRHTFLALASGVEFSVNDAAVQAVYDAKGLATADAVRIVNDLKDTSVQERHFDCCRDAGCPDGTCDKVLTDTKNAHGIAIVQALNPKAEV